MVVMAASQRRYVHLTHWGAAEIESDGRQLTSVRPGGRIRLRAGPGEPGPAHRHPARIGRPDIRRGWPERGPGAAARGSDVFVPVPGKRRLTCWPGNCGGCMTAMARTACSAGPTGGPARAGFITPRASCTGPERPGRLRPLGEHLQLRASQVLLRTWLGTWAWSWRGRRRGGHRGARPPDRGVGGLSGAGTDVALMLALCDVLDAEGLADACFLTGTRWATCG